MNNRGRAQHRVTDTVLEFDPAMVLRLSGKTSREMLESQPDGGRRLLRAVRLAWNTELTPTQRKYLLLYYQDRQTMQAIAAYYNVSAATVSHTLKRARKRLYRVLQFYL